MVFGEDLGETGLTGMIGLPYNSAIIVFRHYHLPISQIQLDLTETEISGYQLILQVIGILIDQKMD